MGPLSEGSFSANPQIVSADALLFDFDGTIVDSTEAIRKFWHRQGELIGVAGEVILATSHGRRAIDTLRELAPAKATWDYVCHEEGQIPIKYGQDARDLPGARPLLATLDAVDAPWALVTSGTRLLVAGWLTALNLVRPKVVVTAEDVANGKPDPECYQLGQRRLNLAASTRMIVLEDAPAGIRAGKAAGFQVVGLVTTHSLREVREAGPDWIVRDLTSVTLRSFQDGRVDLEIRDAWEA